MSHFIFKGTDGTTDKTKMCELEGHEGSNRDDLGLKHSKSRCYKYRKVSQMGFEQVESLK